MKFEETGCLRFVWALNRAKRQHLLTQHSLAEFNAMRCYLSTTERSGFAVKSDGELTCLFSTEGEGLAALKCATGTKGARKLDCFDVPLDGKLLTLPEWYKRHGFRETLRLRFNPKFAPRPWPASEGSPDVVFMVLA